MDIKEIRDGEISLIAGLLLYLSATIAYRFFIGYVFFSRSKDIWWMLFLTSILGVVLIILGIIWIVEGWISNESSESENS